MKPLGVITVVLCVAGSVTAESLQPIPDADRILAGVVARLPAETLLIDGTLTVRRPRGVPVNELGFQLRADWGGTPSSVTYTIYDGMGDERERLSVSRSSDGIPRFEYATGTPSVSAPCPDLYGPIQGSDVSWMDLTLSFLWWRGGRLAGEEPIRGRACYVVDVPAPGVEAAPYRRARLWIDRELLMLLQAEAFDAQDRPVRRLWVKSFKKINDRWMIKDMEVQSYPAVHRTKVRIYNVSPADSAAGSSASTPDSGSPPDAP